MKTLKQITDHLLDGIIFKDWRVINEVHHHLNLRINQSNRCPQFEAYDLKHPHVYKEFCRLAEIQIKKNKSRISFYLMREEIRANSLIVIKEPFFFTSGKYEAYKFPNNYTPYYASKWVKENPQFADRVMIKKLKD